MHGFHVGLPCMKLSLNPSNQKHHGKAARTCSVSDAWREMNDERRGRDKTIDHSLTINNVWIEGSTDMDMEKVIQAEIDRINEERESFGKRKLRKDAVSAIELIQKPPMEVMETLTREEQTKLLRVSDEVVESIMHDWCPEWKTLATVIHYDEFEGKAGHPHKIFIPLARDDDGCPVLNAKRDFNLKFFTFMNSEYPVRMRERGYPVLDCEIYEDMTEEEREAHKEKKKDYGLEGYEYKQKKSAEQEAKIEENDQVIAAQKDQIRKGEETLKRQKEENKDLNIRILSKQEVKDLPMPDTTFLGEYYKVPCKDYKRLLATAKQVDVIREGQSAAEEAVKAREQAVERREQDVEKKRRLPIKEQIELTKLRILEKSVKWIISKLPEDNLICHWLKRALEGEELEKTQVTVQPEREKRIAQKMGL